MSAAPTSHGAHPDVGARLTKLFLAMIVAVALIGFVVGLRQGVPSYEPAAFATRTAEIDHARAVPSMTYAEFDRREHGPNRGWRSTLASLEQPAVDIFAAVHFDDDARQAALEARTKRRAFDGAPPTVPHPIDQMTATACMVCHTDGLFVGEIWAPPMSHEFMANCTQCHVEQWSSDFAQAHAGPDRARSAFVGLASPGRGGRAWDGAPPTVPHPVFMRDNCMSCHGPTGPDPIRTSHPWQVNCLQCHAVSSILDQPIERDSPLFLPPPTIGAP